MADGEWVSAPMGDFKENPKMRIVEENGRPSYFREMTEEEFLEHQRQVEETAKLIEKPVVKVLQTPQRNENFVHWEGVTYHAKSGGKTKLLLDQVDGWLRGGTLTALMVCVRSFPYNYHLLSNSFRVLAVLVRTLCSIYWPMGRIRVSSTVISW
jgi:uncharacterized protein (DUF488 family)